MLVGGPDHIQFSVAWKHKIYKEPHHSLELKQHENVSLKVVLTSSLKFQCFLSTDLKSTVTLSSLLSEVKKYFALSSIKYFRSCASGLNTSCHRIFPTETRNWGISESISKFSKLHTSQEKIVRIIKTIASNWGENMLGYLSLDIICSSKLKVPSQKTVRFSEQKMSASKYPSIFLCKWRLPFI